MEVAGGGLQRGVSTWQGGRGRWLLGDLSLSPMTNAPPQGLARGEGRALIALSARDKRRRKRSGSDGFRIR